MSRIFRAAALTALALSAVGAQAQWRFAESGPLEGPVARSQDSRVTVGCDGRDRLQLVTPKGDGPLALMVTVDGESRLYPARALPGGSWAAPVSSELLAMLRAGRDVEVRSTGRVTARASLAGSGAALARMQLACARRAAGDSIAPAPKAPEPTKPEPKTPESAETATPAPDVWEAARSPLGGPGAAPAGQDAVSVGCGATDQIFLITRAGRGDPAIAARVDGRSFSATAEDIGGGRWAAPLDPALMRALRAGRAAEFEPAGGRIYRTALSGSSRALGAMAAQCARLKPTPSPAPEPPAAQPQQPAPTPDPAPSGPRRLQSFESVWSVRSGPGGAPVAGPSGQGLIYAVCNPTGRDYLAVPAGRGQPSLEISVDARGFPTETRDLGDGRWAATLTPELAGALAGGRILQIAAPGGDVYRARLAGSSQAMAELGQRCLVAGRAPQPGAQAPAEPQQRIAAALVDKLGAECVQLHGGSHIALDPGAIRPAENGGWRVSYRDLRCVGGGASEMGAGHCRAGRCRNELWSVSESGVATIDRIWRD